MTLRFPQVHINSNDEVFVSFYIEGKRYRLFNGTRINSSTNPNTYPINERLSIGKMLAAEIYSYLLNGGVLKEYRSTKLITGKLTDIEYLKQALEIKLNGSYSEKYKEMLLYCFKCIEVTIKDKIDEVAIKKILSKYPTGVSHNTLKRHINVLINEAISLGMDSNPMKNIKSKKANAILHKPFDNIAEVLKEIKTFNNNLYLCCLLTYGCLLRPHREVRELTWGDFSNDLSQINLSGNRNKSGKNRIVPVPIFIREVLRREERGHNIFSKSNHSPNPDYFKTLWSRYKKQSNLLTEGQTLYSFRHTGAIDIFKRTGSLNKLQKALGHSSINVSLTYLRGLEIAELHEEDMPKIK